MSEPQNGHSGLVPEGCVDPSIRKYLKKFNAIPLHRLDDKRLMKPERFREIIEHVFVCRFCRKQLSESGREIFSSEMFWGGYFLDGEAKDRRRNLRAINRKYFSSHPKEIIDLMVEIFRQAETREECKIIERFIED